LGYSTGTIKSYPQYKIDLTGAALHIVIARFSTQTG